VNLNLGVEEGIVGLAVLGGQFLVLLLFRYGLKAFQRWFMSEVIEPHIKPMQEDVKSLKDTQADSNAVLEEVVRTQRAHDNFIYMLLGKVFGGVPDTDVEVVGESPKPLNRG